MTGATGFVGRHLLDALSAGGDSIRGLARGTPPDAPSVEWAKVEDVTDRQSIRVALRDVDAVVHLAARVHVMRESESDPLSAFRRTNVAGTRVVLEESVRAGASTFVYLSSIKAVAEESDRPLTEDVTPAPDDPYGISKLEAEELILSSGMGKIRGVILRPPLVYGPRMKGNMLRLFSIVDRGVPLPFGGFENRRSMVYVENLVAAIRSVLKEPMAEGRYFVSDDEDLSTSELVREIGRALDRDVRLWSLPPRLLDAGVRIGHMASGIPGVPDPVPLYHRLAGSLQVNIDRLRWEGGFEPPFSVRQGLNRTAAWYRSYRSIGGG